MATKKVYDLVVETFKNEDDTFEGIEEWAINPQLGVVAVKVDSKTNKFYPLFNVCSLTTNEREIVVIDLPGG